MGVQWRSTFLIDVTITVCILIRSLLSWLRRSMIAPLPLDDFQVYFWQATPREQFAYLVLITPRIWDISDDERVGWMDHDTVKAEQGPCRVMQTLLPRYSSNTFSRENPNAKAKSRSSRSAISTRSWLHTIVGKWKASTVCGTLVTNRTRPSACSDAYAKSHANGRTLKFAACTHHHVFESAPN